MALRVDLRDGCARLSDWRGTIILVLAIVLLTTAHFLAIYHKHGWRMN